MRDKLLKFRLLWIGLCVAFDEWRNEVWRKDLDGHYCCNGRECGCYAMTRREMYTDHLYKKLCHGRRTRMSIGRALLYLGARPWLYLDQARWWMVNRIIRWRHGPCPSCDGEGVERWQVDAFMENEGYTAKAICSMCEGAGHWLAHKRTMEQIAADISRGGPGGCTCLECSIAKGYDV